jgi:hypothetical protein
MRIQKSPKETFTLIAGAILFVLGIALRFYLIRRGHNFDLDSYHVVANVIEKGGNVYKETNRYNYGPLWFYCLLAIQKLSNAMANYPDAFRYLLVGLLSLVDIGIFSILYKKYGKLPAFLFLLNPITIIITGYHNQFDNLALFFGLYGVLVYEGNGKEKTSNKLIGLLLIALSLITKHLLFLFPIWIAIKERRFVWKFAAILIPFGLFLLSFVPFWSVGHGGIVDNVFGYKSFNNMPFYHLFVPGLFNFITPFQLLLVALLFFGFFFRKRPLLESLLLYTLVLVIFSPAIANQYLAIAVAAASVFVNPFFILYAILSTGYLAADVAGLHSMAAQQHLPGWLLYSKAGSHVYDPLIFTLFLGFIYAVWKEKLTTAVKKSASWISQEFKAQFAKGR